MLAWIAAHPYETIALLLVPAVPLLFFQLLPLLVVMERRGAAFIQDRPGPNRAGIPIPGLGFQLRAFGLVYNLCDFIKLAVKERFLPAFAASRFYYAAGPFIPLMAGLILPAFIPVFAPIAYTTADGSVAWLAGQGIASHSGLLALFAFAGLSAYGLVLGSWAANSKYALLGGLRASAMMVSYEVAIGLAGAGMFLICGSFDLARIVAWQGEHAWGILVQPLGFLLFTAAAFAESNRTPFDVVEGESEIVAGFHTEYGAMRFMLVMSAEYFHMLVAAALISTLFLGGYHLSPIPLPLGEGGAWVALDDQWLRQHIGSVAAVLLAVLALLALFAARLVARRRRHYLASGASDAPRRAREYRFYTGLFVLLALLALGAGWRLAGWSEPPRLVNGIPVWGWKVDLLAALVQFHILVAKTLLVAWLFVWVRWTLPRFRYDQIMALGWKVLLNAALINLLITAVVVKLIG